MALESLGQRRERAAIGPILEFVKRSHEWYEQMYAYQALRALGWYQARSR
jgi:HEAT repeat protein